VSDWEDAQAAYAAFCGVVQWGDGAALADPLPLRPWDRLTPAERNGWAAVAAHFRRSREQEPG
jgi:hypothetical protein